MIIILSFLKNVTKNALSVYLMKHNVFLVRSLEAVLRGAHVCQEELEKDARSA